MVLLCEWIRSTCGHNVQMIWQFASLLPRSNLFLWVDNSRRFNFYGIRRRSNGNSGCEVPGKVRVRNVGNSLPYEAAQHYRGAEFWSHRLKVLKARHQYKWWTPECAEDCVLWHHWCVLWHHRSVSPDTIDLCPLTPQFCVLWHHSSVSSDTTELCLPTPRFCVPWHHSSLSSDTTVLCPLTPQFCVPWHHRLVSPDTTDLCPPTPQFCDRWHHNFAVNTSLFTNNFLSV